MERVVSHRLNAWWLAQDRRPLVVRGARQVGKTWAIRDLATQNSLDLFEINFERDPRARDWFKDNDPTSLLDNLSIALHRDVKPGRSLVFLDEIQSARSVLGKLRWFAEEMPELAVVAAGSLLEFALQDEGLSMPVGRVRYLYISPMLFSEFLRAHGQERLLSRLESWTPREAPLSDALHEKASEWFEQFAMTGGMPGVVNASVNHATAQTIRHMQLDLMTAYRDDFAKYSGRMDTRILDRVLLAAGKMIGRKFVPAHVSEDINHVQVNRSVDMLQKAQLIHVILHSAGNGVPLGGETKERVRKLLLLDVGLLHAMLGTPAATRFPPLASLAPQVRAQIMEQVVGQELMHSVAKPDGSAQLYYWNREGGRSGEIDYLLEVDTRVIPVELKSGAAGSMKSLHQFMFDKSLKFAIRIDGNKPSQQQVRVTTTQGDAVSYSLLNIPHYLSSRVRDLLRIDGAL